MKKRMLCCVLSAAMLVSMTACGSSNDSGSNKTGETITVLNYGKYYDEDA